MSFFVFFLFIYNNVRKKKEKIEELFNSRINSKHLTLSTKLIAVVNQFNKKDLLKISSNIETSKELIYLFLSFFNKQQLDFYREEEITPLRLNSIILYNIFGIYKSQNVYKIIIDLLIAGTEKGSVIELYRNYSTELHISKSFNLSSHYLGKGKSKLIELKSRKTLRINKNILIKRLEKIADIKIIKNLFKFYDIIKLPNEKEIRNYSKIKKISKGRKLIGKVVDKHIEIYNYLTNGSLLIPVVSKYGRIHDSINLLPSWIRELIKIDGEKNIELDFSAFNPSIAQKIYGSNKNQITHKRIADDLELDIKEIKKQHLSFFNVNENEMKLWYNKLYKWYKENEPELLFNMIDDKRKNGKSISTEKIQNLEVEIMNKIIEKIDINVGYIFDALMIKESDEEYIKNIMINIVNEYEIKTIVK